MNAEDKNKPTTAKVNFGENNNIANEEADGVVAREMLFDGGNLMWIAVGLLLVVVGFILMSGGQMPNADTFDETIIYSARRITFAPILIISGLMVVVYAIFKKSRPTH
jgi:Protein of unknown function (DUF3098)